MALFGTKTETVSLAPAQFTSPDEEIAYLRAQMASQEKAAGVTGQRT